jgi:hypothetical protein
MCDVSCQQLWTFSPIKSHVSVQIQPCFRHSSHILCTNTTTTKSNLAASIVFCIRLRTCTSLLLADVIILINCQASIQPCDAEPCDASRAICTDHAFAFGPNLRANHRRFTYTTRARRHTSVLRIVRATRGPSTHGHTMISGIVWPCLTRLLEQALVHAHAYP